MRERGSLVPLNSSSSKQDSTYKMPFDVAAGMRGNSNFPATGSLVCPWFPTLNPSSTEDDARRERCTVAAKWKQGSRKVETTQ